MSLFFILSGYVLAYRYAGSRVRVRDYALNRFARIYPVYVAAAVISLPLLYMSVRDLPDPLASAGALLLLAATATQAWFPQSFGYWNNAASWSISAEAFFYLAFPFLLPLILRARSLWTPGLIAYAATLVPGILFLGFRAVADSEATILDVPVARIATVATNALYSVPLFRIGEFAVGIVAFLCCQRLRTAPPRWVLPAAIALLAGGLMVLPPHVHVTNNWFVVPLIAIIVGSAATGSGAIVAWLGGPVLTYLGRISYCFYSFQLFWLVGVDALLSGAPDALQDPVARLVLTFVPLLLSSMLGYHLVEEPMRRAIRNADRRRPRPAT